jgi:hypothetical protein
MRAGWRSRRSERWAPWICAHLLGEQPGVHRPAAQLQQGSRGARALASLRAVLSRRGARAGLLKEDGVHRAHQVGGGAQLAEVAAHADLWRQAGGRVAGEGGGG